MIVQRTSVFPAGRDTVFHKLRQLSTLQAVAAPYATFEPVKDAATAWEVGSTSAYRFRLFRSVIDEPDSVQVLLLVGGIAGDVLKKRVHFPPGC